MKRSHQPLHKTSIVEIIKKKRDGKELSQEEIFYLIGQFTLGTMADYQMSAFSMAVFFRGMTQKETIALTLAMRDSGTTVKQGTYGGIAIDKHSTGGVGDKISLCLAPIVASLGVQVPMISGRGLGHTGGTVDKLESIPGFQMNLSPRSFIAQVKKLNLAFGRQTEKIAPADRKLYALRDVTATVESIPLITASILSKKLAEGLNGLVLDIKVGKGAFMKTVDDALKLGQSLVKVGQGTGLSTRALLTNMDQPLGFTIGNALEVKEALAVLHGKGPNDVLELTLLLAAEMFVLAGMTRSRLKGERLAEKAITEGRALQCFEKVVEAQGGDKRIISEPDRLPKASSKVVLSAEKSGFITQIDPMQLGLIAIELGAGRHLITDPIDPAVGLELHKKIGDHIEVGSPLITIYGRSKQKIEQLMTKIKPAILIQKHQVSSPQVLISHVAC